jgi:hypothetical protein
LEDDERSLLEVAAVFVDGWTVPAAAAVAGLGEDPALELSEALARHSLIYVDSTELGPRSRMLETVREFVAERLAAGPDAIEVGRRHAGYYRDLAEQADRPLRGAGPSEWLERLDAEAGNLAAAVRWYLAYDTGPLPHLFRILFLFWVQRDLEREARSWVEQLLPATATLDPQAGAALAVVAAVIAVDTGDDAAALAARQRLAPLRGPVRSGVLRRLPAHPAGGGRHRPKPAQHRHPDALRPPRATARKPRLGARCGGEPEPALRSPSLPPSQPGTGTGVAIRTAALPPGHHARRDRPGNTVRPATPTLALHLWAS